MNLNSGYPNPVACALVYLVVWMAQRYLMLS